MAHAIFDMKDGICWIGEMLEKGGCRPFDIVWMTADRPFLLLVEDLVFFVAEHLLPARREKRLVRLRAPLPNTVLAGVQKQRETLLSLRVLDCVFPRRPRPCVFANGAVGDHAQFSFLSGGCAESASSKS